MPPLCVVGLTFSQGLFTLIQGALFLYFTNLLGIILACMIVFILAGYAQLSRPLGWTILLTAFLVIPLGLSFFQLLLQSQIEYAVKRKFLEDTFTGRRVELVRTRILWESKPPRLYLRVRADQPITPRQVGLVEEFLNKALEQNFALIIEVDPVETVTPGGVKPGSHLWGEEDKTQNQNTPKTEETEEPGKIENQDNPKDIRDQLNKQEGKEIKQMRDEEVQEDQPALEERDNPNTEKTGEAENQPQE